MNTQLISLEKELKKITNNLNSKNLFILTGKKSFDIIKKFSDINDFLNTTNHFIFNDFSVNPKIEDLIKGVSYFQKDNYDLILTIGGGSVLDMGKLIKEYSKNYKINLVAIPTTAGSGSEETHFAVLYKNGVKYSIANNNLRPNFKILKPNLIGLAPNYQLACSGADAICQAIESSWSINSTEESLKYSLKALELLWFNLKEAISTRNESILNNILLGSNLAGKAINITKTTAPHAISYFITEKYNIPHGNAVALTLPFFYEYNYCTTDNDNNEPRGANYTRDKINKMSRILGGGSYTDCSKLLNDFFVDIGLNMDRKIFSTSIKEELYGSINFERFKNNPRSLDYELLISYLLNNE